MTVSNTMLMKNNRYISEGNRYFEMFCPRGARLGCVSGMPEMQAHEKWDSPRQKLREVHDNV